VDKELFFLNMMNKTRILRPPKHTLATFGSTTLNYVLLSEIPGEDKKCRRREGRVTAERPKILTPDMWKKRFEGFGEETDQYKGMMDQIFGEAFRGLEYTFKNELDRTEVEMSSLNELAERVGNAMSRENAPRTALLQAPEAAWGLSVMKFIVEMSMRSLPVNLRELQEHDFFDPQKKIEARTRAHVERLFREATANPQLIQKLGETLKETGLFADYEDRFFALIKANS
jgi:hypothetical protein